MARESVKHPPGPEPSRTLPLLASALEAGPALEIDAWSLDQAALEIVLSEVDAGRDMIVECGSGVSTILIGRLLRDRGSGRLYSLEHDPGWVALGRSRIAAEGLADHVCIVEAPLETDPVAAAGLLLVRAQRARRVARQRRRAALGRRPAGACR